ncbi:MAG: FkbM family methyltransferase [Armatimonadota bacterium]|nr:FkbM family methyltransferase [Armatimonadota bacterium]
MERVHEPLLTAFLEDFLRPGMTVVDVGANLGYFTLIAARAVGPTGRVIALEPFPESYRLLQKNIKTNNQRNVFPLPLAAGAQPGTAKLYFYRQANWNGLFTHTGEPLGWVNVEVRPLDQILANEPRVDMIRMDVEGAELEVLEGGRKILDTFGPVIAMEVHPAFIGPVGCKQLSRLLSQFGYSVFYAWERWREEILWPRWVSRWYLPRSVSSSLDLDVVLSPEDWITKESGITIIVARSKDHTVNTAKFGNSSDLVRRTCCS